MRNEDILRTFEDSKSSRPAQQQRATAPASWYCQKRTMNSKVFLKTKGRVEGVDISKNMIVVETSNLGGNTWDACLQVLDFSTKEVIAAIQQPCGCADVCWTKLGQRMVCAEDSGDVKVYRLDEESPARLVEVANLQQHDDIVSTVAASKFHDGLVLSGSYDRSINVWDISSDRYASLDTFTGHSDNVTGVEWTSGEDGDQVFASSSSDCSVRVWDRRQAHESCACHWLGAPVLSLSWDPCSQVLIAAGCEDGTVTVLDKRALSVPVSVQRTHTGRVNNTAFGPAVSADGGQDFSMLASVGDDGVVAVRKLGGDSYSSRSALHSDYAQALSWRDGTTLISGGWDARLCCTDLKKPAAV